MPNNVKNRISAPAATLALLLNDEGNPDFGRVVPCPEIISNEAVSSHVEIAAEIALGLVKIPEPDHEPACLEDFTDRLRANTALRVLKEGPHPKDFNDEDWQAFINYLLAYRETKHMNWYGWNVEHWGTKWNAYCFERISDTEVEFQTAWSAPHPVIEALAMMGDKGRLRHEWADEDTGNNVGYRVYGGEVFSEKELSGSLEGWELAFKLWPEDRQHYVRDGDTYRYVEDDDAA